MHVRSDLPEAETTASIRRVARELDPQLPPHDLEPFAAGIDRALAEQRLVAKLSAAFAIVAALLAAMGIYAMMSYGVGERQREFGIRLALGARAAAVIRLALTSSLTVTVIGAVLGLGASAVATRILEARLFGVTRFDLATMLSVVAILTLVALAASALPARRAVRADPVAALRAE